VEEVEEESDGAGPSLVDGAPVPIPSAICAALDKSNELKEKANQAYGAKDYASVFLFCQ
jgi:hypothetical protein